MTYVLVEVDELRRQRSLVRWVVSLFLIAQCVGGLPASPAVLANAETSAVDRPALASMDYTAVTYGNGLFVAVSSTGWVVTSPDGRVWTGVADAGSAIKDVAYADGTFVAVGAGGVVFTSKDGVQWAKNSIGADVQVRAVTYGAGRWVAVTSDGRHVYSSTDAATWSAIEVGGEHFFEDVAFGAGRFIVLGAYVALSSADGLEWKSIDNFGSATEVSWANDRYFVHQGSILSASTDGQKWTNLFAKGMIRRIHYDGTQYVAVGQEGVILSRKDFDQDKQFTAIPSGVTAHLFDVTSGGGELVAVGDFGTILVSRDGKSWGQPLRPDQPPTTGIEYDLKAISYGKGQYVAVGDSGSVLTSPDGVSWTRRPTGSLNDLWTIAFGQGVFVASMRNGSVLISEDGGTWNPIVIPDDLLCCQSVIYTPGRFVGSGPLGVAASPDGRSWKKGARTKLDDLAYGIEQYVGVNGAEVFTSRDGLTWEQREITGDVRTTIALAFGAGRFVSVGTYGTILSSDNALDWVQRKSTSVGGWTAQWLNGVTYGPNGFVAVGNGGTVVHSPDGVEWTVRASTTGRHLKAVTYGNGQYIAVGTLGTILRSRDGLTWEGGERQSSLVKAVQPVCGSVGTEVEVRGDGLAGGTVWFGEKQARTRYDGSALLAYVPSGSVSGPVSVQLPNGKRLSVSDHFEVVPITVGRTVFTQGIEGSPLVWGKDSLLQLYPQSPQGAGCSVTVDRGAARVMGGSEQMLLGVAGKKKPLLDIRPAEMNNTDVERAINIPISGAALSFDPTAMKGFRYEIRHNGELVTEGAVTLTGDQFKALSGRSALPRTLIVYVTAKGKERPSTWQSDLINGLDTVLRAYPVPTDRNQIFPKIVHHEIDRPIAIDKETFPELEMTLLSYLAEANENLGSSELPFRAVAGIIDQQSQKASHAAGMANWCEVSEEDAKQSSGTLCGASFARVSLNFNGSTLGRILGQELGHNYGLVQPWATNHFADNRAHSQFDEGMEVKDGKFQFGACRQDRSFGKAIDTQMPPLPGTLPRNVLNVLTLDHYAGTASCSNAAKSIMSYVRWALNHNSFLEPYDYAWLLREFGGSDPKAASTLVQVVGTQSLSNATTTLMRLVGVVSPVGVVTVASAKQIASGRATQPDDSSAYRLVFLDQDRREVGSHTISVRFGTSGSGDHPGRTEGEAAPFVVEAAIPNGTRGLEIQMNGRSLYRQDVSAQPPTVRLVSPDHAGVAGANLGVQWEAADPDSTDLMADLVWVGADGHSVMPLAVNLKTDRVSVPVSSIPGGMGTLRVTVSDGFNTATDAVSLNIPMKLPQAVVTWPVNGERVRAGTAITLRGTAMDQAGGWLPASSITWRSDRDGTLGSGDSLTVQLSPGVHMLSLTARDKGGAEGEARVQVEVVEWDSACGGLFSDLHAEHEACTAVAKLVDRNVIAGRTDGTFGPDQTVTRAEFAKMVAVASGAKVQPYSGPSSFTDVARHWAETMGYLKEAKRLKVFEGFPDGSFHPEEAVTRSQVIKVAAAAAGRGPSTAGQDYADVDPAAWYAGWVTTSLAAGHVGRTADWPIWGDELLGPERPATRAEAAMVLANFLSRQPE